MDSMSAACQVFTDQLFQLPSIFLLLLFRGCICEMQLLVPPLIGFHGVPQNLLHASLISIAPLHLLSFLSRKLAYLGQQVPSLILTLSQCPHTRGGRWDLGSVVLQVSGVVFGFLKKGDRKDWSILPTSFCFACRRVSWSYGSHSASMRTKLKKAEQKDRILTGSEWHQIKGRSQTRSFPPRKRVENKPYFYKPLVIGLYTYLNVFLAAKESKQHNSDNLHSMKFVILRKFIK